MNTHSDHPARKQIYLPYKSCGFTILELMIATTVFAVILLVMAVGVIRFTNDYYKGITGSKTQAAARNIMAEIGQAIEFGKNITITNANGSGLGGVCVDNTMYSYQLGQQVIDKNPSTSIHQGYHGLIEAAGGDCSVIAPSVPNSPNPLPAGTRELLGQHMRMAAFSVTPNGTTYSIHIKIIYGEDDLLAPALTGSPTWANEGCAGQSGQQFCATSDLSTTVEKRLL